MEDHNHQCSTAEQLEQLRRDTLSVSAVFSLRDLTVVAAAKDSKHRDRERDRGRERERDRDGDRGRLNLDREDPTTSIRERFHRTYLLATGLSPQYISGDATLIAANGSRFSFSRSIGNGGDGGREEEMDRDRDRGVGSLSSANLGVGSVELKPGFDDRFLVRVRFVDGENRVVNLPVLARIADWLSGDTQALHDSLESFCRFIHYPQVQECRDSIHSHFTALFSCMFYS